MIKSTKPVIHVGQIKAGTLVQEFDLTQGLGGPKNLCLPSKIVVELTYSAMSGSETLDITGLVAGSSTYVTASIISQIDANAAASTVTKTTLLDEAEDAALGCTALKFTATNIASAETIDIKILVW